ncbi:MAG: type II toxin-antitoxin system VapC family toxin [Alphaproteobacteria bacterium]|nr:type II toxin-antitoxin system VapC family toxin [Alphaproteobacteria bacterium]
MIAVVDSSVAIKWFVREQGHDQALALLDRQDELFAPDVIVSDVIDAVWLKIVSGQIGNDQGSAIVAAVTSGVPALLRVSDFAEEAFQAALGMSRLAHLAVYFACVETLDGGFVTADEEAASVARERLGDERVTLLSGLSS